METHVFQDEQENAFHLKAGGNFEGAMQAYAQEYRHASEVEDEYIMGVCIEQLVDCCLLLFLQKSRRFDSPETLWATIEDEVRSALHRINCFAPNRFQKQTSKLRRQLLPLGRGRSPFSVDPRLLLPSRENSSRATTQE